MRRRMEARVEAADSGSSDERGSTSGEGGNTHNSTSRVSFDNFFSKQKEWNNVIAKGNPKLKLSLNEVKAWWEQMRTYKKRLDEYNWTVNNIGTAERKAECQEMATLKRKLKMRKQVQAWRVIAEDDEDEGEAAGKTVSFSRPDTSRMEAWTRCSPSGVWDDVNSKLDEDCRNVVHIMGLSGLFGLSEDTCLFKKHNLRVTEYVEFEEEDKMFLCYPDAEPIELTVTVVAQLLSLPSDGKEVPKYIQGTFPGILLYCGSRCSCSTYLESTMLSG